MTSRDTVRTVHTRLELLQTDAVKPQQPLVQKGRHFNYFHIFLDFRMCCVTLWQLWGSECKCNVLWGSVWSLWGTKLQWNVLFSVSIIPPSLSTVVHPVTTDSVVTVYFIWQLNSAPSCRYTTTRVGGSLSEVQQGETDSCLMKRVNLCLSVCLSVCSNHWRYWQYNSFS
jgi:hypothetical protein